MLQLPGTTADYKIGELVYPQDSLMQAHPGEVMNVGRKFVWVRIEYLGLVKILPTGASK